MYLCNFEIRGTEANINSAVENVETTYGSELSVEDVFSTENHFVAQIMGCCFENIEDLLTMLVDVKVMAFLEDWSFARVLLGVSEVGSKKFDDTKYLFDYDFHGDDRCTCIHYPSESFEDDFLWDSVGEYGHVSYKCPVTDWWEDKGVEPYKDPIKAHQVLTEVCGDWPDEFLSVEYKNNALDALLKRYHYQPSELKVDHFDPHKDTQSLGYRLYSFENKDATRGYGWQDAADYMEKVLSALPDQDFKEIDTVYDAYELIKNLLLGFGTYEDGLQQALDDNQQELCDEFTELACYCVSWEYEMTEDNDGDTVFAVSDYKLHNGRIILDRGYGAGGY